MLPTDEQDHARELFGYGQSMIVEAGAGTGKTSTLVLLGRDAEARGDGDIGQYIAFNKAIVTEAQRKMPQTVNSSTAHSLAYRALGYRYSHRLRSGVRVKSYELANMLGVDPFQVPGKTLSREFIASHVNRAVMLFCQTADMEPSYRNFPYVDGIDAPDEKGRKTYRNNNILAGALEPTLRKAWVDLMNENGRLPYKHDHYLKAWHLSGPKIKADYILFDEAQDANPVLEAIVGAQSHAQLVYVGDSQQAIYGWRGAVNALARIDAQHRAFLTLSFRFGQPIADGANLILDLLDADIRLTGNPDMTSRIDQLHEADALLCRTNAMAVGNLLRLQGEGKRAHLVGGAGDVRAFVQAADKLQQGQRVQHPEIGCFESWGEVQDYVSNDPAGDELRMMVDLVDEFGPARILAGLDRMPREDDAEAVISTAHRAKGREWRTVRLAGDFADIDSEKENEPEWRLGYVAVTRAKEVLDHGGLLDGLRPAAVSA